MHIIIIIINIFPAFATLIDNLSFAYSIVLSRISHRRETTKKKPEERNSLVFWSTPVFFSSVQSISYCVCLTACNRYARSIYSFFFFFCCCRCWCWFDACGHNSWFVGTKYSCWKYCEFYIASEEIGWNEASTYHLFWNIFFIFFPGSSLVRVVRRFGRLARIIISLIYYLSH